MLEVKLEDVKKIYELRKLFNTTNLSEIKFTFNGEFVNNKAEILENGETVLMTLDEWKFTGLSNFDYMLLLLSSADSSFEGCSFESNLVT